MRATDVVIQDCIPGSIQKAKLQVGVAVVVFGGGGGLWCVTRTFVLALQRRWGNIVGFVGTAQQLIAHLVLTPFSGQS